jgi:hypothetical protein
VVALGICRDSDSGADSRHHLTYILQLRPQSDSAYWFDLKEAEQLKELDCELAQGYFARPADQQSILGFMKSRYQKQAASALLNF